MTAQARNGLFRTTAAALMLAALAACGPASDEPPALSAADTAKAQQMLHDYAAARASGNWNVAQQEAERLRSKFPDSDAAATG